MKFFSTLSLLLVAGCTLGSDPGPEGPAGEQGPDGVDGLSCWDLDSDAIDDPGEDANQDGTWDAQDCTGTPGPQGDSLWSNTQGGIHYSGGNVGIGTANPAARLSVNGNLIVGSPTSTPTDLIAGYVLSQFGEAGVLEGHGNGIVGGSIELGYNVYRSDSFMKRLVANATSRIELSGGALRLFVGDDGLPGAEVTETVGLALNSEGNVGVGTASPSQRLHVLGAPGGGDARIVIENPDVSGNSGAYLVTNSNASAPYSTVIHQQAGVSIWESGMEGTTDYHIRRLSGSGDVLIPGGRVGINTDTPVADLDVAGTARLAKYSAEPFPCDVSHDGTIALTNLTKMCVCDGTAWLRVKDDLPCW